MSGDGVRVTRLSVTAIKGMRVGDVDEVSLGRSGARGDRRFFVADERGRMVNGKVFGELQTIVPTWNEADSVLSLRFPDGSLVTGATAPGELLDVRFFSRPVQARVVDGPWNDALYAYLGARVRICELVSADGRGSGVDRGDAGAASLVSLGSLRRLAEEAEVASVDPRRFRMLVEIDGVEPHAEDRWVGAAPVRIGEATVQFVGHVGRCLITSRDPETADTTLDTLDVLGRYRGHAFVESTEPLPFGVYGRVLEPGVVRVGDTVVPGGAG